MLYKLSTSAVLAALLLHTFTVAIVAAEPLPQVTSIPPLIIDCKGPNDHHTALLTSCAATTTDSGRKCWSRVLIVVETAILGVGPASWSLFEIYVSMARIKNRKTTRGWIDVQVQVEDSGRRISTEDLRNE
ncbi:hypothetical protein BT96DRAFT_943715 [Gymnopus androsaceus JB14]|uniref:Uncharacterized protein n=1 Tax=Gymnopus androsaceus JB14 TaxID=1447944 RepID=A0A6A4H6G1_9AGAR|nr:hypothetical protein BT96DRAFT_943715 [Gymnopus androsaceus JB14]